MSQELAEKMDEDRLLQVLIDADDELELAIRMADRDGEEKLRSDLQSIRAWLVRVQDERLRAIARDHVRARIDGRDASQMTLGQPE